MWFSIDPWQTLERVRGDLDRIMSSSDAGTLSSFPLVNIYDSKDDIVITAELPGLSKDNVSITFNDGILTLSGKREPCVLSDKYVSVREERSVGVFEKTLKIPVKVEQNKISAAFKDGVLTVTMPKAEEAKPRQIAIDIK